jgi:pimeloyl-ACP methyl ester carboxylesterase
MDPDDTGGGAVDAEVAGGAVDAEVGVVLVHGLWHGGWAWDSVRDHLSAAAVPSVAVELPMTSLEADVDATIRALDSFDRPAVLVGHSYGGAVITAAGVHPRVRHLVYLAAFQLDEGESIGRTLPELDFPRTRLSDAIRFSETSDEVSLDKDLAVAAMYADATPAIAAAAVARLRPAHRAVFSGVPAAFAWRQRPSTFIVCADDQTVHPDLQRAMSSRATYTHELPCGHSPAAVCPQDVAELILAVIRPSVHQ